VQLCDTGDSPDRLAHPAHQLARRARLKVRRQRADEIAEAPMTQPFPVPHDPAHVWVLYLTARCNFACDYCIQKPGMIPGKPRKPWGRYKELTGAQWVEALNGLPIRPARNLILTGGEPSLHKDFVTIASELEGFSLEMTSNLTFDIDELARAMRARGKRFTTSFHTYHPQFISPEKWLDQAERLRDADIVEQPVFSMVGLRDFPHFRSEDFDENVQKVVTMAQQRGLQYQTNEFRGTHMGMAFDREARHGIECTSAWVNIDPEGSVYNCQYHLTERRNSFGNLTDLDSLKPMPRMGEFFGCTDFGYCDPCHENSGHGAFRDSKGVVFRRTEGNGRIYLKWMEPEAIVKVARRYFAQGDFEEARHAFLAAMAKHSERGETTDPITWADLGVTLYEAGQKKPALAALLYAIEHGVTRVETVASALVVGKELAMLGAVRPVLLDAMPPQTVAHIEQTLDLARI